MQKKQASLEDFLIAYKTFETAVSTAHNLGRLAYIDDTCDTTDSVFSLESLVTDPDVKDKIRTCRIIRNYAQHHADAEEFLAVSASMTSFLSDRTKEIQLLDGTAKDIMKKCPVSLTEESTLAEFAAAFSKMHMTIYPYKGKYGIEVASWIDIATAFGHGEPENRKYCEAHKGKRQPVETEYAFQHTPIAALKKNTMYIVMTQKSDKALGVILPEFLAERKD